MSSDQQQPFVERNFETEARAKRCLTEKERYPEIPVHNGVVHPDGYWAPDWKSACEHKPAQRIP
jgi:hypothetical protein